MTDARREDVTRAEPPVRDGGPAEAARGDREVPPAPGAAQEVVEVEGVEEPDALAEATRERDEYLDSLQRLKAEFENYRKRVAREQAALVARATERLVKELLPVLDDLARALDAAERHEEAQLEEGVRLVHRQLAAVLEKEGVAEIATDGAFDPNLHEALLAQPSERPEGTVIEVLQRGYRLGDRVLRPARVVVAAAAAPEPPAAEAAQGEPEQSPAGGGDGGGD